MCTWRKWKDPTIGDFGDLMVAVSTCWAISTIYMYIIVYTSCIPDYLFLSIIKSHHIYQYLSILLYTYLSLWIYHYLSINLSIHIFLSIFIGMFINIFINIVFNIFINTSVNLSINQSIYLPIHPSIHPIYLRVCHINTYIYIYISYNSLKQMYNMIDFNMSLA